MSDGQEIGQRDPLNFALVCGKEEIAFGVAAITFRWCICATRQSHRRRHNVTPAEFAELAQMFGAAVLRNFMDGDAAAPAILCEQIEIVTRIGGENGDFTPFANLAQGGRGNFGHILAAQFTISAERHPDLLVGQQVRSGQSAFGAIHNLGAPRIAIFFFDEEQIFLDQRQKQVFQRCQFMTAGIGQGQRSRQT